VEVKFFLVKENFFFLTTSDDTIRFNRLARRGDG